MKRFWIYIARSIWEALILGIAVGIVVGIVLAYILVEVLHIGG